MAEDTSSSDFLWQSTHKPPTNEPEASGRNRSSLPSSSTPQGAAPTSNHGHTPRLQRLPTPSRPQPTMKVGARCVSSLLSHVPDAALVSIFHVRTIIILDGLGDVFSWAFWIWIQEDYATSAHARFLFGDVFGSFSRFQCADFSRNQSVPCILRWSLTVQRQNRSITGRWSHSNYKRNQPNMGAKKRVTLSLIWVTNVLLN